MQSGKVLQNDADLEYVINCKHDVKVLVGGEVDYIGPLEKYTINTVVVPNGDRYLRKLVQMKTV